MEQELEERIRAHLVKGKLPCAVAFKIAAELNVPVRSVGDACNRLDIRIANCQLGCFP